MGYAFLIFNFRGYGFSAGKISINNQLSDAHKILEFSVLMAKKGIFMLDNINVIAHDFGAFIALLSCYKNTTINKLLLLSPILDLERHVHSNEFKNNLIYLNKFLPGLVKGIENVGDFIQLTKKELSEKQFRISYIIKHLKNKKIKIIIGEKDKLTPLSEVSEIMKSANISPEIKIINNMEHEWVEDREYEIITDEIKKYFQ
jgi:alpha-beta hydrolase superfamily lysophospholipase